MKLKIFNKNLAQENTYLLIKNKQAIVIDPGFNGSAIEEYCLEAGITIKHVILTHGHFDHIRDLKTIASKYYTNLYISIEDAKLLFHDDLNYARSFNASFHLPTNIEIREVSHLEKLVIFDEEFIVYKTPGHTKGSICIKYLNKLFTGDTLFYNSIGRTDLYSGNSNEMFKSIDYLKQTMSNDITIYPGHGEYGKLKIVKENNPYL